MSPLPVSPCSVSDTTAIIGGDDHFNDIFEGPEKTLSLCFKTSRLERSLRSISQEAWSEVLQHAKCEILSFVESTGAHSLKKDKVNSTRGITAYLLSESSLLVTDTSLVLKTCGRTTPLMALGPILDLVVPKWQKRGTDAYIKFASFTRLGYVRPEEQLDPHTSWEDEVAWMDRYFKGETVVLGTPGTTPAQHVYVANYAPKDEVMDAFVTQVAFSQLHSADSMQRYVLARADGPPEEAEPLRTAWGRLHDVEDSRSICAQASFDERFFEPVGYSSNAVFGRHYTTIHATPQPSCSYLSVETSAPLTREAQKRFVAGATTLVRADEMLLTDLSLNPMLFSGGEPPPIPGWSVCDTQHAVTGSFACAHHRYKRCAGQPSPAMEVADARVVAEELPSEGDLCGGAAVLPAPPAVLCGA